MQSFLRKDMQNPSFYHFFKGGGSHACLAETFPFCIPFPLFEKACPEPRRREGLGEMCVSQRSTNALR